MFDLNSAATFHCLWIIYSKIPPQWMPEIAHSSWLSHFLISGIQCLALMTQRKRGLS